MSSRRSGATRPMTIASRDIRGGRHVSSPHPGQVSSPRPVVLTLKSEADHVPVGELSPGALFIQTPDQHSDKSSVIRNPVQASPTTTFANGNSRALVFGGNSDEGSIGCRISAGVNSSSGLASVAARIDFAVVGLKVGK